MHAVLVHVSVVRTVHPVGADGALAKATARDSTKFLLTVAALFHVHQVRAAADARYRSHRIVDDGPLASR
jgi:chromosome condensin MukBEF MukE localization factor